MGQDQWFSDPKDVTVHYRRSVRRAPRVFSALLFVWGVLAMVLIVKGPLWQLVSALALVLLFLFAYPALFQNRRDIKRALHKGGIVRALRLDNHVLKETVRPYSEPNTSLSQKSLDLHEPCTVTVDSRGVSLFGQGSGEFVSIEIKNEDFLGAEARREFVAFVLREIEDRAQRQEKLSDSVAPRN